jgi:hypothetical protein
MNEGIADSVSCILILIRNSNSTPIIAGALSDAVLVILVVYLLQDVKNLNLSRERQYSISFYHRC